MANVSGAVEFFDRVRRLIDSDVATKALRKGVINGLKVIGQEQKATAPVDNGLLKRSIGKPVFSRGTGRSRRQKLIMAKVGINTGQKKAGGSFAPHGSFVALGTFPRWTGLTRRRVAGGGRLGRPRGGGAKIAYRGFMGPNPFIRRATIAKASVAQEVLRNSLKADWGRIIEAGRA